MYLPEPLLRSWQYRLLQLQQTVGELFADWAGVSPSIANQTAPQHGNHHIPFDSQPTHIALACPAVAFRDPNYFCNVALSAS